MELFNKKTEFIFKHNVNTKVQDDDLLFIFENNNLYMQNNRTLRVREFIELNKADLLCFGTIGTQQCFCLKHNLQSVNIKLEKILLKTSHIILSEVEYQAAILANHLSHWLINHKYCGACTAINKVCTHELALQCSMCNLIIYPTVSPVVIGLIYCGNDILLAKAKNFTQNMYGCVSGFVNPGENLEFALMREVDEEVGLKIKNIKYVSSQHWPFPSSLMIGFTAEYLSGEIKIDNVELEDAAWFNITNPNQLPQLPSSISISRYLIDGYIKSKMNGRA